MSQTIVEASTRSELFAGYPDMLTMDDVAHELGVCVNQARIMSRRGDFPSVKIGRRVYVPKSLFIDFIMSGCEARQNGNANINGFKARR